MKSTPNHVEKVLMQEQMDARKSCNLVGDPNRETEPVPPEIERAGPFFQTRASYPSRTAPHGRVTHFWED